MYPPGTDVEFTKTGNFDSDCPDVILWFLEHYPFLPKELKPIEVIQEPGEIIFVPGGWWHQVLNLEDTIALTQNYCNEQNFPYVSAEIEYDDDDFFDEFKEKVSKKYPNLDWSRDYLDYKPFKI